MTRDELKTIFDKKARAEIQMDELRPAKDTFDGSITYQQAVNNYYLVMAEYRDALDELLKEDVA